MHLINAFLFYTCINLNNQPGISITSNQHNLVNVRHNILTTKLHI